MKISKKIKAKIFAQYIGAKVDISDTDWYKEEAKLRNRFIRATLVGVNLHEISKRACIQHNIKTQNNGLQWLDFNAFKLKLKPLSGIKSKDAYQVSLFGMNENWVKEVLSNYPYKSEKDINKYRASYNQIVKCNVRVYQYLQSKGYALPYMEYSIEELVEQGVYKLI